MKKLNFTTIGISILILLNLAIAGSLFFGHSGRGRCHAKGPDNGNEYANFHEHHGDKRGHGDFRKHGHFRHAFMKDLNLSEEQKTKMDTLRKVHHEETKALMNQLHDLRMKEFEMEKFGNLSAQQMDSLATQFANYQKELHLMKLKHFQAIGAILTPEQKEKMAQKFENFGKDGKGPHHFHDCSQY